jgi:hypothetical protein
MKIHYLYFLQISRGVPISPSCLDSTLSVSALSQYVVAWHAPEIGNYSVDTIGSSVGVILSVMQYFCYGSEWSCQKVPVLASYLVATVPGQTFYLVLSWSPASAIWASAAYGDQLTGKISALQNYFQLNIASVARTPLTVATAYHDMVRSQLVQGALQLELTQVSPAVGVYFQDAIETTTIALVSTSVSLRAIVGDPRVLLTGVNADTWNGIPPGAATNILIFCTSPSGSPADIQLQAAISTPAPADLSVVKKLPAAMLAAISAARYSFAPLPSPTMLVYSSSNVSLGGSSFSSSTDSYSTSRKNDVLQHSAGLLFNPYDVSVPHGTSIVQSVMLTSIQLISTLQYFLQGNLSTAVCSLVMSSFSTISSQLHVPLALSFGDSQIALSAHHVVVSFANIADTTAFSLGANVGFNLNETSTVLQVQCTTEIDSSLFANPNLSEEGTLVPVHSKIVFVGRALSAWSPLSLPILALTAAGTVAFDYLLGAVVNQSRYLYAARLTEERFEFMCVLV